MEENTESQIVVKQKLNFWVIIFFVCLLFTFMLWDHYFDSSQPLDRDVISNLVLLMGTLFSVSASLFAWSLESGMERLEKRVRKRTEDLQNRNQELEKAIKEINVLQGLLPICASCKKIRNDKGYWQQIEEYLGERAEIQFTHGLCKHCAEKMYQEFKNSRERVAPEAGPSEG